jgi:DNA-binding beta-propeller fold protein YncE
VLANSTRLACAGHSIRVLAPSGLLQLPFVTFAGSNTSSGNQDGPGADARVNCPMGITVDPAGNVVVVDYSNDALRLVSKAGAVRTLAGGGGAGFADGQGAAARFDHTFSVVVTAIGDYVMTDCSNHAVRVVTPGGAVRTLAGNGEPGFVDGQGAAARFNWPMGLAVNVDGSILVTDSGNHVVRRVTMAGAVSTAAGKGRRGMKTGRARPRASITPAPWWWTRRARS